MTRTYSEQVGGKWRVTRSHAVCDDCGKEHPESYQGRVTAPLPHGWIYRERVSQSGKSTQMLYSCGCKTA